MQGRGLDEPEEQIRALRLGQPSTEYPRFLNHLKLIMHTAAHRERWLDAPTSCYLGIIPPDRDLQLTPSVLISDEVGVCTIDMHKDSAALVSFSISPSLVRPLRKSSPSIAQTIAFVSSPAPHYPASHTHFPDMLGHNQLRTCLLSALALLPFTIAAGRDFIAPDASTLSQLCNHSRRSERGGADAIKLT